MVLQSKIARNFTRGHMREALEVNLERLQTDCLETYLFHSFDSGTPLEESIEGMAEALGAGKIRAYGCSNFSVDQLQAAIEVAQRKSLPRPETVEPMYNLVHREIEQDLLPFCRENRIGATSYSPSGTGFHAGRYTPDRAAIPRGTRFDVNAGHVDLYFGEAGFRIVERPRAAAEVSGMPMVRLALARVLQQPGVASVLVGARRTVHPDNALLVVEVADAGGISLYDFL